MELYNWYEKHKDYINEKSYSIDTNRYWYKHKTVRRAFVHIKNALPNIEDFFLVTLNQDYIFENEIEPKKLFKKRIFIN